MQYDSYKDSGEQWLGQIPSHWEMKRWRFLLAENSEQNNKCRVKTQLQFKYGDIVPKANQEIDEDVLKTISKYTVVQPNDIMINGLNLNYDFISQRIAQVREVGVITSAYISLRPLAGIVPQYYNYFLKAMDSMKMFHGMGTGVRLTLSYKELRNRLLPLPPQSEQERMVAYLDEQTAKIDAAIAQQQKMIDLLNERKQIIIQNAVTKGLDPNAKMKDSGIEWIGNIPAHWKINRFKFLFKTLVGITFTKDQLVTEGCPVISYGQIHSKDNYGYGINDSLVRYIPSDLTQSKDKCIAYKGDFLFADTSEDFEGCGNNVCVDREKIYAGYHTIIAKKEHKEFDEYLAFLFSSKGWRGQIRTKVNGVKVYSVTQTILKLSFVILPPIEEQKMITQHIRKSILPIDELVKNSLKQITLLRERKQIIINEVVTGKIKV